MSDITAEEFRAMQTKGHKFHAKAVKYCPYCGFRHPSKVEAARCAYWAEQKRMGQIVHYDVHPVVTLDKGIQYRPDFAVWEYVGGTEQVFFEEVKGKITPDFALKRTLFDNNHPAAPLHVVRGKQVKGVWRWEEI